MAVMILAIFALAAQLANPGFEQGLEGWRTERHRGMGIGIMSNRGYTIRQSAEGEHFLTMGWRARNRAPDDALVRVFTHVDARRYRGRTIRVSAQTRAPDFAGGVGTMIVTAADAEARTSIAASGTWRRHAVTVRVPRRAEQIEISFQTGGTAAELNLDDVRLKVLR